jgi:hypothetical protein
MGAIGHKLPKGVFSLAKSTNQDDVGAFLSRLRDVVTPNRFDPNERIVLVVDNHPSHGTEYVRTLARQLNIELLHLPPYSPELNSIEALWAIFKLDLKNRLQQHKSIVLDQKDFRSLVHQCIANVSPEQQQRAARFNNRAYMHRMLREMLVPQRTEPKAVLEQRVIDQVGPPQIRVPPNSLEVSHVPLSYPMSPLQHQSRWHSSASSDSPEFSAWEPSPSSSQSSPRPRVRVQASSPTSISRFLRN